MTRAIVDMHESVRSWVLFVVGMGCVGSTLSRSMWIHTHIQWELFITVRMSNNSYCHFRNRFLFQKKNNYYYRMSLSIKRKAVNFMKCAQLSGHLRNARQPASGPKMISIKKSIVFIHFFVEDLDLFRDFIDLNRFACSSFSPSRRCDNVFW